MEAYGQIFVFQVTNMRNAKLKEVRAKWRDSRSACTRAVRCPLRPPANRCARCSFFMGKNKVTARALGRTPEEEVAGGLHQVSQLLVGNNVGLLFTARDAAEVKAWFASHGESEVARAGDPASETIVLAEGALPQFPHSIEPHLRKLGLPTSLQRGVIHLVKPHTVCTAGSVLSPEQAQIVKLLGYKMAEFKVELTHRWAADAGELEVL